MILIRRFCLIAYVLVLAGCSTYLQQATQIRNAYYSGNLATADNLVAEGLKKHKSDASLLKLEKAMVDLANGAPDEAERSLREVRDHFDELEGALVTGKAASYLTDDTHRAYSGEDYEQLLIRAFLALSNLMQDGGDAEAYSLQLIAKQDQLIEAGKRESGENPKENYPRVALAPYLRGMLREATHHDYDDAQRSYVSVVDWQPTFEAGKLDLERSTHGRHSQRGNGVLYIFALTGRGPYKREVAEAPSSASLFIAGEIVSAFGNQTVPPNVAPVKVPQLVAHANPVQFVGVSVNGQPIGRTDTITNVTQLAVQQYEAVYPQVVGRAVARRVLKKGIIYGAKEASGMNKGSPLGLAADIAGIAWEATETADTRCWGLLPDKIQVLRAELAAGQHDIGLCALNASGSPIGGISAERIRIADSRNTYVLASFPDNRLVGKALVSQR